MLFFFFFDHQGGDASVNSVHLFPKSADHIVVCNKTSSIYIMTLQGQVYLCIYIYCTKCKRTYFWYLWLTFFVDFGPENWSKYLKFTSSVDIWAGIVDICMIGACALVFSCLHDSVDSIRDVNRFTSKYI